MIAFGLAAAGAAIHLDRTGPLWFVFGAILGPLALVLLRAAPPGHCRACGSPTRGWLKECWWCREDVRTTPSKTLAMVARLSGPVPAIRASPRRERAKLAQPLRPYQIRADDPPAAPPATAFGRNEPVTGAPSTGGAPASIAPAEAPSPMLAGRNETNKLPGRPPASAGESDISATEPARTRSDAGSTRVLATAVYVTGSTNLESGRWYGIAIHDSRLQVLGPTDIDPSRVALDRPIAGMDARSVEGRLIVGDPHGLVLAFMAVYGPATQDLAALIVEAARGEVGDDGRRDPILHSQDRRGGQP